MAETKASTFSRRYTTSFIGGALSNSCGPYSLSTYLKDHFFVLPLTVLAQFNTFFLNVPSFYEGPLYDE